MNGLRRLVPPFYQNIQRIGKGAFGTVYKATLTNGTGGVCALKQLCLGQNSRSDVRHEIDALLRLRHCEGIVQLMNCVEYQGSIWLEMEFCDNGSLNHFFRSRQSEITGQVKFQLMVEMAFAMEFLHSNGVVHRDLKPDNILISTGVDGKPHIKIGDFGLAKIVATSIYNGDIHKFYMNSTKGTLLFMASEVFGGHYTVKADNFSLGLIYASLIIGACDQKMGLYFAVQYGGRLTPIGMMQSCNQTYKLQLPRGFSANRRMQKLIYSMLNRNYHHRPTMEKVVTTLQTMSAEDLIKSEESIGFVPNIDRFDLTLGAAILLAVLVIIFRYV